MRFSLRWQGDQHEPQPLTLKTPESSLIHLKLMLFHRTSQLIQSSTEIFLTMTPHFPK